MDIHGAFVALVALVAFVMRHWGPRGHSCISSLASMKVRSGNICQDRSAVFHQPELESSSGFILVYCKNQSFQHLSALELALVILRENPRPHHGGRRSWQRMCWKRRCARIWFTMAYNGLQWLTMAYLQVLDGFRQNFRQRCPGNWLIGWTTDEKHMPQFLRITITRWRVAFERETTDQQEVRAVDRGSPYYIQRLLVVERDFCVLGQEHSRAHSQQQPQISNKLCAWEAVWMATVCQWSELHFRGAWCIGHASSVFA